MKENILKVAFLDRDGALIWEPTDNYQIDTLAKLKILDGVTDALRMLKAKGYILVMVSNQDGLGTASFPYETFEEPHQKMLELFKNQNIEFTKIFICPHTMQDQCLCRKPQTGLVKHFLKNNSIDPNASLMYGDRDTDETFAKNIGVHFIKTTTNSNAQPLLNFLTKIP